ncbi:MAG: fibronectin type III domain-containing protein, partial [Thermoplasmata archaeon]|nr:fibronectin type III domain-containing protein [Thermoplasmata archaeon]
MDTTETSFTKTGLENGRVYSFQVSAENLGGIEGPRCYEMPIRPCGLPGKASTLNLEEDMDRVLVMWDVPTETGGTDYFRYNILRGTSPSYLELIEELIETTEYLDWNITFGQRYYYSVLVWNDAGWGPECDPLDILVITGPGLVGNFKVEPHDGYVRLSWDEPGFDGGKVVSEYKIIRGYNKFELERTVNITNLRENEDHTVENNRLYWYAIVAKNDDQWGVNCSPLSVTPLSRPGKVSNFRVIVVDEHIVLSWLDPSVDGCFPITGYKVKRGTSPGDLQDYDTVGLENTYRDVAVDKELPYYYQIIPVSDEGPGQESTVEMAEIEERFIGTDSYMSMLLIALVLVLVIVGVVVLVHSRRRTEPGPMEPAESLENVPPWRMAEVQARMAKKAAPAPVREPILSYIIEEVFVVYRDGRLITSCAREECRTDDADLMSGM